LIAGRLGHGLLLKVGTGQALRKKTKKRGQKDFLPPLYFVRCTVLR
jgi:hypothetical protein